MDWTALNQVDAESGAKELKPLTEAMAAQVEERPQTAALLMDLFARHLEGPITPDSYTPLWEGVMSLFGVGDDAPQLFSWLVQFEPRERLEALVAQSPPALARLLRECIAVYGQDLQQAYRRWREIPDNWEWVQREANFDIDRGRYRLDLTILKFNGETLKLSMDARSLLLLVARLTNSLSLAAAEPFTDEELDNLRQETDAFWRAVEMSREKAPEAIEQSPAA